MAARCLQQDLPLVRTAIHRADAAESKSCWHPCSADVFTTFENRILAALADTDLQTILPALERGTLSAGQLIHEAQRSRAYAYFPGSSIVSLVNEGEGGDATQLALIGREGMAGTSILLGAQTAPYQAVVLAQGSAYRISAAALMNAATTSAAMGALLLRYTQLLIAQIGQVVVCNRFHRLEQQICRILLEILDRQSSNRIVLTQESLAHLLGVRREGASTVAAKLKSNGIIRYRRGVVVVVDRAQLESLACECYGVIRRESRRLMPASFATPPSRLASSTQHSRKSAGQRSRSYEDCRTRETL